MRRILPPLLSAFFLLGAVGAASADPQSSPPSSAPITVPPLAYHLRVLPNGLKLYWAEDKTTPNVTVQVWYNVGAKNDPPGRSGFAHLFEHLMFKGTQDMPPEYMDRLTEDVGGFNNASTSDDYTEYHEVIPANHLQRLLWAESERMGGLVVDEANFHSERAVVEEELRQRVLADPYGRLYYLDLAEASFDHHPYHRPPIGSIADLEQSSVADVRAFHAVYYRPDNANLIVIGNFDPHQLNAWADKYFGPIATPATPIPQVTARDDLRTSPRTLALYGDNVPLPAVVFSYQGPAASSPDAAALKVLDAVMTTGKSSRLYQSLVYHQQIASQVLSEPDLRRQEGLIMAGAILAQGAGIDQVRAALETELARLRDAPVSDAELSTAKNQLLAQVLEGRETVDGRASELGGAITVEGDAARVNQDVTDIAAVTAVDVQRVARRWLNDAGRVTIVYQDESKRPAGQPDALVQDSPQVAATALPVPADIPVVETLPEGQRQAPPAPGVVVAAAPPRPAERTLANGLRVIVAKTSDLPIVSAELSTLSGAALDPDGKAGLANLTAQMLPQGAGGLSATRIAAQVESLGGSIGSGAGYDQAYVSLTGLAPVLPQSLGVLARLAERPDFAPAELDRLKHQSLDDLTVAQQDPGSLGGMVSPHVVFGAGAYGHPAEGGPTSLPRITRDDVAGAYGQLFRPDRAVLVLTGDIEPEAGFALAQTAFGGWTAPTAPPPSEPAAGARTGRRILVVDLPGTGQAAVMVAGRTIARSDPAYHQLQVANAVLGGGYSARLNEEVRIKRGLSYGASSRLSAWRDGGLFSASAQTKNESADEVAGLILAQIDRLSAAAAPDAEVEARKAGIVGDFGREAATASGLGQILSGEAADGLPLTEVATYVRDVEKVTPDEARAAAARLVDPAQADVIVVGDAAKFIDALRKRFGQVEVVEAAKLNFDAP